MTEKSASTRLYCILARNAPVGVIFRRGPSKHVCLIKWDLKNDTFETGQWFKGRIYERRCDLSPSGDKLVYFAAKYKEPIFSWTAVSKPPYLTALMLWEKGDGWGGGGLFESEYTLLLNHRPSYEMVLSDEFKIPKNFKVKAFGSHSGGGEDDPICDTRLKRDGWQYIEGKQVKDDFDAKVWIEYDPPITYRKSRSCRQNNEYLLEMKISGIKEKEGSWYVTEYDVVNIKTQERLTVGRTEWADWDQNGDLLYSKEGKLFRLRPQKNKEFQYDLKNTNELADFSDMGFEEKAPTCQAKKWK